MAFTLQPYENLRPRTSLVVAVDGGFTQVWYGWLRSFLQTVRANDAMVVAPIAQTYAAGFTGTIATAKLTGGGSNGSMTFTNGILTSQTPAT